MAACLDLILAVWILFCLIAFITLLCTGYTIFKSVQDYRETNKVNAKRQPLMFWSGLFFFTITILLGLHNAIYYVATISSCNPKPFSDALGIGLYAWQLFGLWLVLFIRIYLVFKEAVYRLSKYTIYTVTSFFVIMVLLFIICLLPIWPQDDNGHRVELNILVSVMLLLSFIYSIWISIFFVYKLISVFKGVHRDKSSTDNALLSIITKNTILAVMSIIATFIAIIIREILTWGNPNVYGVFSIDVFTNFVCIALSYQIFDKYYQLFCGCVDNKCQRCCTSMMGDKHEYEKEPKLGTNHIASVTLDRIESTSPNSQYVESPSTNFNEMQI